MRRLTRLIRPTGSTNVGRIRRLRRIRQAMPDVTLNVSYQAYGDHQCRSDKAQAPHPTSDA
ncbi:hypothetical protein AOY87_07455 [Escherichia coli]|nr:hypothetical protein AOY87_07455 [Escherichia coli]